MVHIRVVDLMMIVFVIVGREGVGFVGWKGVVWRGSVVIVSSGSVVGDWMDDGWA